MHIDWFVFFAQIFNFLILLFLLKKFLYGRIITAIDARDEKIALTFTEAEKSRQEAIESVILHEKRIQELESKSEEMLNRAREDAEQYRNKLMKEAREQVEMIQSRWIETLRSERDIFFQELRQLAAAQVYAIARRVLQDLAGVNLEDRIIQILSERIIDMDSGERDKIKSMVNNDEGIAVHCAFEISTPAKEKLNQVIRKMIGGGFPVSYEKSIDVLSGYELRVNGYKIAWSMKDYMDTLEENFYHVLYRESQEQKQVH